MTKKMHKANAASSDKLFVIGLDDSGNSQRGNLFGLITPVRLAPPPKTENKLVKDATVTVVSGRAML